MRPGTPGFVGERLREAREARGLTAAAVSDLIGVTRAAVSQYENGAQSPHPDVMRKLAGQLNLPARFFLRGPFPEALGIIHFRSRTAATKTERIRAARRHHWLKELVDYLRRYVELPSIDVPEFDVPTDPKVVTTEMIEEIASETRRVWKLGEGPISNVVWLLESHGIIVANGDIGSDALDSFSEWNVAETPYIFLGAGRRSSVRGRLNAGHELGHLILHRRLDPQYLQADHRLIEDQAFWFAGAFLLPATTFAADLYAPTLGAFKALKPRWKVSIQAMISRARDLQFLSEDQAKTAWISLNRQGWRVKEPLDDEIPVEEPRLLRTAFDLLVKAGINCRAELLANGICAPEDAEALLGLPRGVLKEESPIEQAPPMVRVLNQRTTASQPQNSSGSKVVEFKRRSKS